jgi:hypothetical protein
MSTPLTSLPISVSIDYNLRLFTVQILDIIVIRPSLRHALDELILKLYEHHKDIQALPDDQLSSAGQDFQATILEFGSQTHFFT